MMLILSRAVFLMIPRTGSTWARQALRNSGVRYKEWGAKHSTAPMKPDAPGFRFTFVREPAAWVASRWTLGPWEDQLRHLWCPDPEEFAARVTAPMVEMYFEQFRTLCNFVGHTEALADDLVKALTQAGEKFSERDLRATPRLNESGPEHHLDRGAYYDLMPEQWCQLPPEEIVRIPTDLMAQLPDAAFARLSPEQMIRLSRRLQQEASPQRPRDVPIQVNG
jgi:hypothetical protein